MRYYLTEEEQEAIELFKAQQKRFYNEIKKKGKKYSEGIRPLIESEVVKVKGMTKVQLLNCLNEAIGQYDHKQADKSAKLNRQYNR